MLIRNAFLKRVLLNGETCTILTLTNMALYVELSVKKKKKGVLILL